jgi:hypothetical protein
MAGWAGDARSVQRLTPPRLFSGLVLAGVACSGCAPSLELSVTLDPAALEPRRVVVEVHADTSCEAVADAELPPAPLYADDVAPGEAVAPLPVLPRGRYAVTTRVLDSACRIVARGCVDLDLPTDPGGRELRATALPVPEQACASIASCVDGRCGGDLSMRDCGAPTAVIASSPSSGHVAYVQASNLGIWTLTSSATEVLPRPDGPIAIGSMSGAVMTCGVFGGGLRCEDCASGEGCTEVPDLSGLEVDGLGIRSAGDWRAVSVGASAICGIVLRELPMDAHGQGVACIRASAGRWSLQAFPTVDASAPERPVALDMAGNFACALTASGEVTCLRPGLSSTERASVRSRVSAIAMGGQVGREVLCVIDGDDARMRCGTLSAGGTISSWDTPADVLRPSAFAVRDANSGCAIVSGNLHCWGELAGAVVPPRAFPLDDVVISADSVCVRSLAGDLRCGQGSGQLRCLRDLE